MHQFPHIWKSKLFKASVLTQSNRILISVFFSILQNFERFQLRTKHFFRFDTKPWICNFSVIWPPCIVLVLTFCTKLWFRQNLFHLKVDSKTFILIPRLNDLESKCLIWLLLNLTLQILQNRDCNFGPSVTKLLITL